MRNQKEFKQLDKPVDLIVHTKSPEKWILLDRETGESYQGNKQGHWDKLKPIKKKD